MNANDLAEVEEAMRGQSDERRCTPSGVFLDLLRRFAEEEKIAEIAKACEMYFSNFRGSRNFVSAALPAIILNYHKPLTRGMTFSRFLEWSEQNPNWWDEIRRHASSPKLASVIDQMKTSIKQF